MTYLQSQRIIVTERVTGLLFRFVFRRFAVHLIVSQWFQRDALGIAQSYRKVLAITCTQQVFSLYTTTAHRMNMFICQ